MVKTVSLAVAYLMLVVATFVAEAVLATTYMSTVYRSTSQLPAILESFGSGLVYGSYFVAPKAINTISRGVVYTTVVFELYVTVINPNPNPAEVVILGYVSNLSPNSSIVNLVEVPGTEIIYKSDGVAVV